MFHSKHNLLSYLPSWRGAFACISGLTLQTVIMGLVMTSHVKRSISDRNISSADEFDRTESRSFRNNQTTDVKNSKSEGSPQGCDNDGTMYDHCDDHESELMSKQPIDMELCEQEERDINTKQEPLLRRLRAVPQLIKKSNWNFVFDFYYILILINLCTCMPSVLSFIMFTMDYAKDRGFTDDSTGVFFLFVIFICSMGGRLLIGVLNMVPFLHSIILMGIYGMIAGSSLIVLGSVTQYSMIVGFLVVLGIGAGGAIAIYTKTVLDVDSVTMTTYPLALGLAGTMEGILDCVLPIFIGELEECAGNTSYSRRTKW